MHVYRREKHTSPIVTPHGETIYELLGRYTGQTTEHHSVAHVVLSPGASTLRHYHPSAEESYYVLHGTGRITVGNEDTTLSSGEIVLIPPRTPHKFVNTGIEPLEFLVVCVPAWEPTNTVWLEGPSAHIS